MNSTLPQSLIDDAMAEDAASARAEYFGQFRDDISAFISREMIEALVVSGRHELPPQPGIQYAAFVDLSGGRGDAAVCGIGHKVSRKVILDCLECFKSPHDPYDVVAKMCQTFRRYGCDRAIGDAYSAEWSRMAFEGHGIKFENCSTSAWKTGAAATHKIAKPKSVLYAELLPRLTSGEVELLDNELLISQLAGLERRTRSGGRDVIDHPPGGHDDLANCLAGVCDAVQQRPTVAGGWNFQPSGKPLTPYERELAHFRFRQQRDARQGMTLNDIPHDELRGAMKQLFPNSRRF